MTHDELVAKVDRYPVMRVCDKIGNEKTNFDKLLDFRKALYAVMELHKPITTPNNFSYCPECQYGHARGVYPCPTIQAIEKELK